MNHPRHYILFQPLHFICQNAFSQHLRHSGMKETKWQSVSVVILSFSFCKNFTGCVKLQGCQACQPRTPGLFFLSHAFCHVCRKHFCIVLWKNSGISLKKKKNMDRMCCSKISMYSWASIWPSQKIKLLSPRGTDTTTCYHAVTFGPFTDKCGRSFLYLVRNTRSPALKLETCEFLYSQVSKIEETEFNIKMGFHHRIDNIFPTAPCYHN